jgi:CCCH zinc finger in TRM13 protein
MSYKDLTKRCLGCGEMIQLTADEWNDKSIMHGGEKGEHCFFLWRKKSPDTNLRCQHGYDRPELYDQKKQCKATADKGSLYCTEHADGMKRWETVTSSHYDDQLGEEPLSNG